MGETDTVGDLDYMRGNSLVHSVRTSPVRNIQESLEKSHPYYDTRVLRVSLLYHAILKPFRHSNEKWGIGEVTVAVQG